MAGISSRGISVRRKYLNARAFTAWACVTLFILYGAVIPFRLTTDRAVIADHLARVTLNPLLSPDTGRRVSLPDVAQNILLFLPFGLFGAWAFQGRPGRRSPAATMAWVAGWAVLLSVAVEGLQLFTLDRVSSVTDVVADTSGALVGAAIWYPLRATWRRSFAASRAPALVALPAFSPLVLAALLVCAAAWQPFDVTLDVGNAVQKWHALRSDVWQRTTAGSAIIGALRYVLFALAAVLWLRQAGVRRAGVWAALLAVIGACGLEGSEAAIESRMPGLADLLAHLVGTFGGVWLARGWPHGRSPLVWAGLLAVATAIGAAVVRPQATQDSMMLVSRGFERLLLVVPVGVGIALALRAESHD
jgi:VanZ family protein